MNAQIGRIIDANVLRVTQGHAALKFDALRSISVSISGELH